MNFEEIPKKFRIDIHYLDPINGEPAVEARYFTTKEYALAEVEKINALTMDIAKYIGPVLIDP